MAKANIPVSETPEEIYAPARSPGVRLGHGPRTPPIKEESTSPLGENPPARAGGNVKRTKSLMQKFKTMVRTRSGSVEHVHAASVVAGGQNRSHSMNAGAGIPRPILSPGGGIEARVLEEEELADEVVDEGDDVFGQGRNGETYLSKGVEARRAQSDEKRLSGRR